MQASLYAQQYTGNSYNNFQNRPSNYSQSLWKVDDREFYHKGDRFVAETSAYVEATIEQGMGPLETAPVPDGMVAFAQDLIQRFGVTSTEFTTIRDVMFRLMSFLDYSEPYYLLVDSAVELSSNNLTRTYRHKKSNNVIPADTIETFRVKTGYDFTPFKVAMQLLDHPQTKAVFNGQIVMNSETGRPVTKDDVLERISKIVWGQPDYLESWVDEWVWTHYEDIEYARPKVDDDTIMSLASYREKDHEYWLIATLGGLLWFRSPHALRFLIEYHPIYGAILDWDKTKNHPVIREGSGGEAVVSGYDIYSLQHLIVENTDPGTCGCCKQPLHCTKFVNAWAIKNPVCSCGRPVHLEIQRNEEYLVNYEHRRPECQPYMMKFPPFFDFVCHHCMFNMMNNLPPEMKCGRKECPNTSCNHHMGQQAHIRSLTERRTLLLTGMQGQ